MEWGEIDVHKTVSDICDLLPDDEVKGFSLLLTTAAIFALELGHDDDQALASFIAALREVRAKSEKQGVH
ncbi:hypothetical protein [Ensifer sp. ZNC0028]|uniref:hypothetical protein n=1 Tax=Ensifer sp. ZNC0028 TaxID=1339236 RepID=UPI0005B91EBE|nr:hypothetical protein [Ensifer sp. ZNC0028]